jgi:hypothetical protein
MRSHFKEMQSNNYYWCRTIKLLQKCCGSCYQIRYRLSYSIRKSCTKNGSNFSSKWKCLTLQIIWAEVSFFPEGENEDAADR